MSPVGWLGNAVEKGGGGLTIRSSCRPSSLSLRVQGVGFRVCYSDRQLDTLVPLILTVLNRD